MRDAFGNEFKDSASTINPTIRSATLAAHSAFDSVTDDAVKTADWLNAKTDLAMSSEKEMIGKLMKYVDSNPLKAVGMALAAGALIARIL